MACKINVMLPSGSSIPALGFGTWQAKDEELEAALEHALSAGYRHIDTALVYENEKVIGRVLKKWTDSGKIKREELFIVTKLPSFGNRPSDVEKYMNESLESLQLDYVDLYLIHSPFSFIKNGNDPKDWTIDKTTDLVAIWKEMEKLVDEGKTKAIGVSNFNVNQVDRILKNARISPATNQVELHVYLQQPELVKFCQSNNVTVTAYSPIGSPGSSKLFEARGVKNEVPNLTENQTVLEIAKNHEKTAAQILLRHLVQKNIVAIPKSTNPQRIKENISIFDFELTSEEMKKLDGLNINGRIFRFDVMFKGTGDHPEYPFEKYS